MADLRQETRDRLAFLDDCPPPPPMKVMPNSMFKELMYKYANSIGFTGSKDDVEEAFLAALQGGGAVAGDIIVREKRINFPSTGDNNKIYYDNTTNNVYFWDANKYVQINIASSGIVENTILYGGDASTILFF